MTMYDIGASIARNIMHVFGRHKHGSPDFDDIHDTLHFHHTAVKQSLHQTHKHARKLFRKHRLKFHNLRQAGTKVAAGAALAGTLFVAPAQSGPTKIPKDASHHTEAQIPPPPADTVLGPTNPNPSKLTQKEFGEKIKEIMQGSDRYGTLKASQLQQIQTLLQDQLGVNVSAKTDSGFELNAHYGYVGREQHLPTHPGDSASNHVSNDDKSAVASGVTPGRGAWGYVAPDEEKWYVVGQTFLSNQFGSASTKTLGGQRYIVIEIPEDANGNYTAVFRGGLWDAGPGAGVSKTTSKVFGASPEFFHVVGDAAAGHAKFKAIMLPETGDPKPASDLGPLNSNFKQP